MFVHWFFWIHHWNICFNVYFVVKSEESHGLMDSIIYYILSVAGYY